MLHAKRPLHLSQPVADISSHVSLHYHFARNACRSGDTRASFLLDARSVSVSAYQSWLWWWRSTSDTSICRHRQGWSYSQPSVSEYPSTNMQNSEVHVLSAKCMYSLLMLISLSDFTNIFYVTCIDKNIVVYCLHNQATRALHKLLTGSKHTQRNIL